MAFPSLVFTSDYVISVRYTKEKHLISFCLHLQSLLGCTPETESTHCGMTVLPVGAAIFFSDIYRLVGLVVRRPPRERKVPGSNPACDGIFSRSSHTSDLNIGTSVAALPGAWRFRVSAGTGRPSVSIL